MAANSPTSVGSAVGLGRFTRPAYAYDGVKTRCRELRRDIRNWLGTGRDPAPSLDQALYAARQLASLVDLTSSGRYGLAVVDGSGQHYPINDVRAFEKRLREEARR